MPDEIDETDLPAYLQAHPPVSFTLMNGYVGVVLGLREAAARDGLYADALARVAESLAETIRGQCDRADAIWTSDQATQLYAIWLSDQVNGTDHGPLFSRWRGLVEERFLEKETGLLVSYISVNPDAYLSEPRGSSLYWTVIFLADVMPEFAREQYTLTCKHREQRVFSMAATTEYRKGDLLSFGDLDSGPLVFGFGPAATGYALGAHKLFGDEDRFARVYRVFELFGRPRRDGETASYYLANAMGDAILLYAKVARPRLLGDEEE